RGRAEDMWRTSWDLVALLNHWATFRVMLEAGATIDDQTQEQITVQFPGLHLFKRALDILSGLANAEQTVGPRASNTVCLVLGTFRDEIIARIASLRETGACCPATQDVGASDRIHALLAFSINNDRKEPRSASAGSVPTVQLLGTANQACSLAAEI